MAVSYTHLDVYKRQVQTFGMIILLTLMALTFGKDIYQLVMDKFFTNH